MSILYESDGFFCQGAITYLQKKKVKFGRIILTNEAIICEGGISHGNISKNSTGYNITIPLSQIKKAFKSKKRMLHIFIVETLDDNFFTFTFGGTDTTLGKERAISWEQRVNQALSDSSTTNLNAFCTECGNKRDPNSKF